MGLLFYDPSLNLVYVRLGQPLDLELKQRPGDNKWLMTIWAA